MTLFATSVLDNFNRANETPLGAGSGWDTTQWYVSPGGSFSSGRLKVVTNVARFENEPAVTGTVLGGQVRSADVGPDCEVYATIPSMSASGLAYLLARAAAPGSSGSCYAGGFDFSGAGAFGTWRIEQRFQADIQNPRVIWSGAGAVSFTTDGWKIGFRVWGSNPVVLELFVNQGAGWLFAARAHDFSSQRITSSGRIGIHAQENTNQESGESFDDFGGGTFTAPSGEFNPDTYPGYVGGIYDPLATPSENPIPSSLKTVYDRIAEAVWTWLPYIDEPGVLDHAIGEVDIGTDLGGKWAISDSTTGPVFKSETAFGSYTAGKWTTSGLSGAVVRTGEVSFGAYTAGTYDVSGSGGTTVVSGGGISIFSRP